MFFTLIKNYFRSIFGSIVDIDILPKRTRRIKRVFNVSKYVIDIDFLSTYGKREFKSVNDLVAHYDLLMNKGDLEWRLSYYFLAINGCIAKGDIDGEKAIVGFIEYVILTDRTLIDGFSCKGVRTYINKLKVSTISDVRNDKLDKLLQIK